MNIFDRVEKQGFMLLEAFQSFRELVEEAKNNGYRAGGFEMEDYSGRYPEPRGYENEHYISEEELEALRCGEEDAYYGDDLYPEIPEENLDNEYPINSGYEMFPGRKFFRTEDLDMSDPEWSRGKEIGIPVNLAIRLSSQQGLQIPFARGPITRGY